MQTLIVPLYFLTIWYFGFHRPEAKLNKKAFTATDYKIIYMARC